MSAWERVEHEADVAVVGGGLAGLCAAVAAARHGARVVLMQDRPVLGGNASSEVRMWVCGSRGHDRRETGLIEEIHLDNLRRNPLRNFSLWDALLYEKAAIQPGLVLLLNCSCNAAEMDGDRLASVTGWQTTTQTWQRVAARLFIDASGDSVLAPLSGAAFRHGREARGEFGESIAPPEADRRTMGMSCLLQAREMPFPVPFEPPAWAHRYSEEDLAGRDHDLSQWETNFWWIEHGGLLDTIRDTEVIRDELLKIVFGVWDHIKNRGEHGAGNWALDWVGFLPGKRESRRYEGDHVLTQHDVRSGGRFADLVAYGGWPMDDHPPAGFYYRGEPTIFHEAPPAYGIPYRCLYSRNVANLFCAGRNISASHAALSSTRVMATCATIGQAAGTAAALAARAGLDPRAFGERHRIGLQQALLDDDCYLPGVARRVPDLAREAQLTAAAGDPEPLRNGLDRPVDGVNNGWTAPPGSPVEYAWPAPRRIGRARIVFDSDLNRPELNAPAGYPLNMRLTAPPATLVRSFRIEARDAVGGWRTAARVEDNHQRLVRLPLEEETSALRLVPETTWGSPKARLFAWDVAEEE